MICLAIGMTSATFMEVEKAPVRSGLVNSMVNTGMSTLMKSEAFRSFRCEITPPTICDRCVAVPGRGQHTTDTGDDSARTVLVDRFTRSQHHATCHMGA